MHARNKMPKYFVLAFLVLTQTALHILPGDTIHTETIDCNGFDKSCPGLLHSLFPKKKISFDRNGQVYDADGTRGRLSKIVDLYNN